MKKFSIVFLLIAFCGGSAETVSTQTDQKTQSTENASVASTNETNEPETSFNQQSEDKEKESSALTLQTLPDIKEFMTNKSDRFFVDFEDIIAGHPYVGKRSPIFSKLFILEKKIAH